MSNDIKGMARARIVAREISDCTRRNVGAALMRDGRLIFSAANRSAKPELFSCTGGMCPRGQISLSVLPSDSPYGSGAGECFAVHAEMWVLIRTSPEEQEGSTLCITHEPCHQCRVMLLASHLLRVIWPGGEMVRDDQNILKECA